LKNKFGELFDICDEQTISVAMASRGWRLTFGRWLDENAQNQLRQLRDAMLVCALGYRKMNQCGYGKKIKFTLSNQCILIFVELMSGNLPKKFGRLKFH
jgi:hypothetical protein